MTGFERISLKNLVVEGGRHSKQASQTPVWNLNLDQIESDTGRVLAKQMIAAEKLGPSTYPFEAGTVLYSKLRPYLNKVVVADDSGVATTELVPLRCDPEKLLPQYLAYFLRSSEFLNFANTVVAGAKMPRMVMSEFWNYKIPAPPLAEQRRIAAILDQADALRAKRRESLAQLDVLQQSIFIEMFGDPIENDRKWPCVPVSDFVAGFESGKSLVADDEDASDSPFRVLKISAVTSLEYRPEHSKAVPSDYIPPASHMVRKGDLLFSRANTTELIGATAYVNETPDNLLLPDKLWRFVWFDEPKAEPLYVRQLFWQAKFRQEIGRRASGTSGSMQNISQPKVLSIQVGHPPVLLQQDFAKRVRIIEVMKLSHRNSLAELEKLFASLQHRAFRGEL